jgi:hypothetical protein
VERDGVMDKFTLTFFFPLKKEKFPNPQFLMSPKVWGIYKGFG